MRYTASIVLIWTLVISVLQSSYAQTPAPAPEEETLVQATLNRIISSVRHAQPITAEMLINPTAMNGSKQQALSLSRFTQTGLRAIRIHSEGIKIEGEQSVGFREVT